MRVGLISCSKKKLDYAAPAQDLYLGNLFKLSKQWIITRVDEWGILSAQHGLVMPDQVLEPYDLALSDLAKVHRERWAEMTKKQIARKWDPNSTIFMKLLGANYSWALYGMPMVEDPVSYWTEQRRQRGMSGRKAIMGIGVIMKYLKEDTPYG